MAFALVVSVHCSFLFYACTQLRTQQIHLLQIVRRSALVLVATLGEHCSPDDELALRMADDAEAKWQAEQARARQEQQVRVECVCGGGGGGGMCLLFCFVLNRVRM